MLYEVITREDVFNSVIDEYIPPQSLMEMWDIPGLEARLKADFGLELPIGQWLEQEDKLYEERLRERIVAAAAEAYKAKEEQVRNNFV